MLLVKKESNSYKNPSLGNGASRTVRLGLKHKDISCSMTQWQAAKSTGLQFGDKHIPFFIHCDTQKSSKVEDTT